MAGKAIGGGVGLGCVLAGAAVAVVQVGSACTSVCEAQGKQEDMERNGRSGSVCFAMYASANLISFQGIWPLGYCCFPRSASLDRAYVSPAKLGQNLA